MALAALQVSLTVTAPRTLGTAAWQVPSALAALQESLTVTAPRTLGTAAWQVPSALAAGMTEQVTTGLVLSITVKVVEQESLFPAASVAVTVMVWTPRPISVPAAGL